MKLRFFNLTAIFFFLVTFTGCNLVEGIFRAGAWVTILGIIIIAALIYALLSSVSLQPVKSDNVIRSKSDDQDHITRT